MPVFANTGVTINNVAEVMVVTAGCIIGTHFKVDGDTWNSVDESRVFALHGSSRRLALSTRSVYQPVIHVEAHPIRLQVEMAFLAQWGHMVTHPDL